MSIASRNHNIEIDAKEIIKTAKEKQIVEVIIVTKPMPPKV